MKNSSTPFIIVALLVVCAVVGVLVWQQQGGWLTQPAASQEQSQKQTTPVNENTEQHIEKNEQKSTDADTSRSEDPSVASVQTDPAAPSAQAGEGVEPQDPSGKDEDDQPWPEPTEDGDSTSTPPGKEVITGTIAKGDTAAVLLNNWLPKQTVYSLLEVTRKVYSLAQIHEGQPYTLVRDVESGEMESFEYEIDSNRKLIVQRQDEGFSATLERIEYETKLVMVEGSIKSSLFQAMTDAGEQASLVMIMADIFAWEINFIKDLREGDAFSILVEKRYREGEFRNYGKVLAATFTNQNSTYEAFRFADQDGQFRFFNAKGESLEKTLLKAPLPFTRVTSGYSMNRLHPIFNVRRAHQGIDYGAPNGTPIKAVGSGVVTTAGWVGGYGKQVVVRHSKALESMYSHMSGYARGIKSGTKVRQGQIIGYVGATGNATGPHLDFRLRQNGAFINPSKAINPRIHDLDRKQLPAFRTHMSAVRQYMDGTKALSEYKP